MHISYSKRTSNGGGQDGEKNRKVSTYTSREAIDTRERVRKKRSVHTEGI